MKRHLIFNNLKSGREFFLGNKTRIELFPGQNWLSEDDLNHLQKNSGGFQHSLKQKEFTIENKVREETPTEKSFRLKMMEKGKTLLSKLKPNSKEESAPFAGTEEELEVFKQSLKEANEAELEAFKQTLKVEMSVENGFFRDSIRQISIDIGEQAKKTIEEAIREITKAFITDEFAPLMKETAAKYLEEEFQPILDNHQEKAAMTSQKAFDDSIEAFVKNLDKVSASRLNSFNKKLERAALKAEQK